MRLFRNFLIVALAFQQFAKANTDKIFRAAILPNSQQLIHVDNPAITSNPTFAPAFTQESKDAFDARRQQPGAGFLGSIPGAAANVEQDPQLNALAKVVEQVINKLPANNFSELLRSQFSIDWSEAVSDQESAYKAIKYLLTYELKNSCDPKQLSELLAVEAGKEELEMNTVFDPQKQILNISCPSISSLPAASLAFLNDNKVLIFGSPKELNECVENIQNNKAAARLKPAMQTARTEMGANKLFYMILALDDNIKNVLQTQLMDSPASPILDEIVTLTVTLEEKEATLFQIAMDFSSEPIAQAGKAMIFDGFLLSMAKMFILQNVGNKLPIMDTMKTDIQGSKAIFSCELKQEDIKGFLTFLR